MPRMHSREFKLELCSKIRRLELSKSKACRDHALSEGLLARWLTQFDALGEEAFSGQEWRSRALSAAERIQDLEERLRIVELEKELLRLALDSKKSWSGSESK